MPRPMGATPGPPGTLLPGLPGLRLCATPGPPRPRLPRLPSLRRPQWVITISDLAATPAALDAFEVEETIADATDILRQRTPHQPLSKLPLTMASACT